MARILITLATLLLTFASIPARAQICTPFTDVAASDQFCTNIQWMFNRGVTLGCTATQYCPTNFVRRDQMAAFMNRLADKAVFQQGGNAFGDLGTLGTTDNEALEIIVNNSRVMRYEPNATSPNVIGGHASNVVTAGVVAASIGGGGQLSAPNRVTDHLGTVAGGDGNRAGNNAGSTNDAISATVGGGYSNIASGRYSTIPGGVSNEAKGQNSFAAGTAARADFAGCFVYADSSSGNPTSCNAPNEIILRALGGFYFWTAGFSDNTYSGARLATGTGAWAAYSDRRGKENIQPVDTRAVLEKLLAMPIATWQWKSEPGAIRHVGPMAQDFRQAFGLGDSDTQIVTVDADGVALAAIQGLNAKLEAKIDEQASELAILRLQHAAELAELRRAVQHLLTRGTPEPALAAR